MSRTSDAAMPRKRRSSAFAKAVARPKKRALVFALTSLEHDVEQLPREFEYVIHPGKHLMLTYLRGIVYGLGALTAAAIVIPLLLWILQSISGLPLIGDFVSRITTQVEMKRR